MTRKVQRGSCLRFASGIFYTVTRDPAMFVADFGEQSPNQFEQDRAELKAGAIVRHRQRPEGPANLFIVTNRTTRAGVLQMRVVNAEHDYSGFYPASELEFLQSTTARQAVGRRRVLLAYRAEHSS